MWVDWDDGHAGGYPHECTTSTIDQAKADPQAPLIFALECLMHESWSDMPEQSTPTDVRLHYIQAMLRHFDVTPKANGGYRPDRAPFTSYANT